MRGSIINSGTYLTSRLESNSYRLQVRLSQTAPVCLRTPLWTGFITNTHTHTHFEYELGLEAFIAFNILAECKAV